MTLDSTLVLGGAVIGLLVGMTGAGGGALMTPMLLLLFSVKAPAAISSDLVAAVVMRPFGAAVHLRRGTVHSGVVRWLVAGSVPSAFLGAFLLHIVGTSAGGVVTVERVLGATLLLGSAAVAVRGVLDRRRTPTAGAGRPTIVARRVPTLVVGVAGGLLVGFTSVGAGSLMIVLLLFVYPAVTAKQLVGTDLVQAVPLTLAAALGAVAFGHVEMPVTASLVVGGVPAVIVGSLLSSKAPDRWLRPVIGLVILASGLEYAGLGSVPLALALGAVVAGAAALRAGAATRGARGATARRRRRCRRPG